MIPGLPVESGSFTNAFTAKALEFLDGADANTRDLHFPSDVPVPAYASLDGQRPVSEEDDHDQYKLELATGVVGEGEITYDPPLNY